MNLKYVLFLFALIIIFTPHVTADYNVLVTPSTDDSQINNQTNSSNYGSSQYMLIYRSTALEIRGVINFSLPSVSANHYVLDSNLYLYKKLAGYTGNISVYNMTGNWDESTITWDSQPALGTYNTSPVLTSGINWYSYDVTEIVRYYVNNSNYGFELIASIDNDPDQKVQASFVTKDSSDYRKPKLYINISNAIPTTPTVVYPVDESGYEVSTNITLNVSSTDGDSDGITYYFYGGTSPSNMVLLGTNDTAGMSTYNWTVSSHGILYWTAKAYDGYEYSSNMTTAEFTAFRQPNLLTPTNTSTINTTYPPITYDVTFTWNNSSGPYYRIMISEDYAFNIIDVDTVVSTTSSTQSLLVNDEYYWKVYPYDGSNYGTVSDTFEFNISGASSLSGSSIEGVTYGGESGAYVALSGAQIYITNGTWSSYATTSSTGYYQFTGLKEGEVYSLQASKDQYITSPVVYVNTTSSPITKNFYLVVDRTSQEWWHYVRFVVTSLWGTKYENVAVSVYEGDDVTASLLGTTGTDGSVTFHLYQQTEYRLTFINATQGISKTITIYPKDTEYYVYVTASKQEWKEHDIPVRDGLDFTVTKSIINATHAYVNVTYTDVLSQTTGINVYLNQSNSSDIANQTTIDSYSSSGNITHSFIVSGYLGQSYFVHFEVIHTTYGTVHKTYSVTFKKTLADEWPGIPKAVWVYGSIFFLIFVGATFASSHAEIGAVLIGTMAWAFYLYGLWDPLPGSIEDKMVLGATLAIVLGVADYISKKSKEEGYA